jgi:hypothetical protein
MRNLAIILFFTTSVASAQTVITPAGTYVVSTAGSTTHVTQTAVVPGARSSYAPSMTAPSVGSNTYITPTGTYMTSRVGSTVHVIQTSKGSGARK